ncbi:hypothetical protein B9Z55_013879 [Caenorhabditis nigoni]|uniref:SXP/RAL-2 family protein Ani s 5-like cation-binding domain-containing protein n=1 Tax=Caenorhabditis nigoni TaxID=1611254 RepID=A0A2G5U3S7_9PELO|nr:hypothetical protein B9Z55_013879 [Caenorhabditis nigoni]
MSSLQSFIALSIISVVVIAAPGGNGNGYQQYQQGGYQASEMQQGGMQRDQGLYRGQGQLGGSQGGFGGQGGQGGFGGQDIQGGVVYDFLQGLPMPPFLQNVTEQARRQYMAIVTNSSLTISEIGEQTSAWAQTNNVSEQYEAFTANVTAKLEEMKQNVTSVLTNLSSVLNSLESILENEDQTLSAQKQAVDELRQESPAEVAALFFIAQEVAMKSQEGQRGHHGSRGGNSTGRPNFSGFSTTTASG